MANRYWVGGSGNWSSTSHWSTSSGGGSGASVPTAADDVIMDTNSFSADNQAVNVDGSFGSTSKCKNFDSSAVTRPINFTFSGGFNIEVNGNSVKDGANITYDWRNGFNLLGNPANGAINMLSNSTGLYINVVQGVWKLQHALRCGLFEIGDSSDISHPPTFDMNGFNMTTGEFVAWGNGYGGSCTFNSSAHLYIVDDVVSSAFSHFELKFGTTANISSMDLDIVLVGDGGGIYSEVSLTMHDVILGNAATTLQFLGGFTCHNLTINNGSKYSLNDNGSSQGRTITVTNLFTAQALCEGIRVYSYPGGTQSTINAASVSIQGVDFKDIIAAGAASPFTDVDGIDSGNNTNITFTVLNRYWVGGTGNWDDSAHWATTTGGTGGYCPPDTLRNAYFDANSFSGGSQTVSIRSGHTNQCKDINTTGATNSATLHFSGSGAELDVYGNVVITSGIGAVTPNDTNNPQSTFIKLMSTGSQTISIASGASYGAGLIIGANGTFDLAANSAVAAFGLTNTGLTSIFNANNHTFTMSWMEWLAGTLNMDSATFSFVNGMPNNEVHCKLKSTATINAGTSTVEIHGNGELFSPGYPDSGDVSLYNLHVIATTGSNTNLFALHIESGALGLQDLSIAANCSMQLYAGNNFSLPNYGINVAGSFTANGTAGNLIYMNSYSFFGAWNISCDTVSVSYIHVTSSIANGFTLPFDATNHGEDGGGNYHWIFSPRYWVGGTGNYVDAAHWAESSGGAGGASLPHTCTNVFFDSGSFSGSGQIVTIQPYPNAASCRAMDWTGVTNNPTMNLDSTSGGALLEVTAGFKLAAGMSVTSTDPSHNYPSIILSPQQDGNYDFDPKGVSIPVEVDFKYWGTYDLLSDFTCFGVRLQNSGSSPGQLVFNSNDWDVTTGFFQMNTSNNTYPCTLNAGDSIFTMGPTRSYADQGFGTYDTDTVITFTSGFTINVTYPAAALWDYYDPDLFLNAQSINAINFLGASNAANPYVLETDYYASPMIIDSLTALPGAGLQFFGDVGNYTTTITHFHLHGEDGNPIHIFQDPDSPTYQFQLDSDDVDVSFLDVQSCYANGATLPFIDTGGTDNGNTTNWSFPPAPPPHPGAAWLEWFYLRNGYYPSGRAYAPDNSIFAATDDLQFFVLMEDNTFQMTKNTYYGIERQAATGTSFNLTPSFAIYKKIKNCIEDVFNTYNGIDFAINAIIDPDTNIMYRKYLTYYPRQGINNTGLNFSYPGNIKKFDLPTDGKTMTNEAIMRGQGSGLDQLVDIERGYASIFTYGARQDVEQMPDVDDEGLLSKSGQEVIRVKQNNMILPGITLDGNQLPYLGSYSIGDSIRIQITNVPAPVNAVYRIEQIHVTISDDDQEEIDLTLSSA